MKNLYTTVLIIAFAIQISIAQNAPDFEITDTKGKTHKLYEDYLDKGKSVVLDLFFVDCPPCNTLAPLMEPLYQDWGAGEADVQFFSISFTDANAKIDGFKSGHGNTFPAAGTEGGGPAADDPYSSGQFGQFFGYPTLVVISPDKTVQYDVWDNNSFPGTIELLDQAITNTGAMKPISAGFQELDDLTQATIFPNPIVQTATLDLMLENTIDANISIVNTAGKSMNNIFNGLIENGRTQMPLDFSNLVAGNYLLHITSEEGKTKSLPFIKIK